MELGSGAGFLGIIIGSLQQISASDLSPSSLWLTDVNEEVLSRCRYNVQMSCSKCLTFKVCSISPLFVQDASSSHPSINYCLLDWSAALYPTTSPQLQTLLQDEINAELILGADIVSFLTCV